MCSILQPLPADRHVDTPHLLIRRRHGANRRDICLFLPRVNNGHHRRPVSDVQAGLELAVTLQPPDHFVCITAHERPVVAAVVQRTPVHEERRKQRERQVRFTVMIEVVPPHVMKPGSVVTVVVVVVEPVRTTQANAVNSIRFSGNLFYYFSRLYFHFSITNFFLCTLTFTSKGKKYAY